MLVSIMDMNNLVYLYQSYIQFLTQNPLSHLLTLVKGLTGNAQREVFSLIDLQTTKYSINELTDIKDSYALKCLAHGTSENVQF